MLWSVLLSVWTRVPHRRLLRHKEDDQLRKFRDWIGDIRASGDMRMCCEIWILRQGTESANV